MSCVVSGARDRRGYTLLVIAGFPAAATDRSWRAFRLFACTAAGRRIRAEAGTSFNEVWMADVAMARAGEADAVSGALCSRLQAEVHGGRRTLEDAADELERRARRVAVAVK